MDSDNDLIVLSWEINYSKYTIEIFNDGTIEASIFNSQCKDVVKNCELETIFNMINQSYISYGTEQSKLRRYINYKYN